MDRSAQGVGAEMNGCGALDFQRRGREQVVSRSEVGAACVHVGECRRWVSAAHSSSWKSRVQSLGKEADSRDLPLYF